MKSNYKASQTKPRISDMLLLNFGGTSDSQRKASNIQKPEPMSQARQNENLFSLYPNPANNIVTLFCPDKISGQPYTIKLYNFKGEIVINQTSKEN